MARSRTPTRGRETQGRGRDRDRDRDQDRDRDRDQRSNLCREHRACCLVRLLRLSILEQMAAHGVPLVSLISHGLQQTMSWRMPKKRKIQTTDAGRGKRNG